MGKSFRNEITPGNFIFRTREFEQMEMEFFVKPGEDEKWHEYWMQQRWNWYTGLGLREENMRWFEHPKEKLSHYSKRTADIEYRFHFGGSEWGELEGVANRTDYDLAAHSKASGQDLSYFDQEAGERWYAVRHRAGGRCRPRDAGVPARRLQRGRGAQRQGRAWRSARCCASTRASRRSRSRSCRCPATPSCRRRPRASPPTLRQNWNIEFDDAGAIGRRYRRQDEIGTPFCVTVDFDTLDDNAVTVRERDTMEQERVSLDQIEGYLARGCSAARRSAGHADRSLRAGVGLVARFPAPLTGRDSSPGCPGPVTEPGFSHPALGSTVAWCSSARCSSAFSQGRNCTSLRQPQVSQLMTRCAPVRWTWTTCSRPCWSQRLTLLVLICNMTSPRPGMRGARSVQQEQHQQGSTV